GHRVNDACHAWSGFYDLVERPWCAPVNPAGVSVAPALQKGFPLASRLLSAPLAPSAMTRGTVHAWQPAAVPATILLRANPPAAFFHLSPSRDQDAPARPSSALRSRPSPARHWPGSGRSRAPGNAGKAWSGWS